MPKAITATIITLNEEADIEAAVASAARVCDEVIVIDSRSADRTCELAEKAGARVVLQTFLGDGRQKDFAVDMAKNDWILSLDADEVLEDELVHEINALDLENAAPDGYLIRRKNHIGDRWIKIWYPDYVVRLYDRRRCRYTTEDIHASVTAKNAARLNSHIIHRPYADYADYARGVARYGIWGAKVLTARGKKSSPALALIHGTGAFIRQYVMRGGMFHGFDGLMVAVSTAYCVFLKYAIVAENRRTGQNRGE